MTRRKSRGVAGIEQIVLLSCVAIGGAGLLVCLLPLLVERHKTLEAVLSLPFP